MAAQTAPHDPDSATDQLLQAFEKQLAAERQACPPSVVSRNLQRVCTSWERKHWIGPAVLIVLLLAVPGILLYTNDQASFLVMSHLRLVMAAWVLPMAEWIGLPQELCLIGNPLHVPPYVLNTLEDCRNCNSLDRVIRIRKGPFGPANFVRDLINTQQPAVIDPEAAGSIPLFSAGPANATPAELAAFYSELPPLEPQLPHSASSSAREAASLLAASVDGVCDFRHSLGKTRPDLNSPSRLLRAAAEGRGLESGWAASWRNCDPVAVRKFRHYLGRPNCLPLSATLGHSHLLLWNSYPGHRFLPLPTRREHNLLLLHQVTGTSRIELTPRDVCRSECPSLQAVLRPGQLLSVSNFYYRLAWLPLTMGEGFAVGLEADTVNFY